MAAKGRPQPERRGPAPGCPRRSLVGFRRPLTVVGRRLSIDGRLAACLHRKILHAARRIVERREAPPSALFRFVPDNVAAQALSRLAAVRRTVVEDLGRATAGLEPAPVSVIVFGSFARGEADAYSDLDVVVVRPAGLAQDDPQWRVAIDGWRERARRLTGNPVETVEVSESTWPLGSGADNHSGATSRARKSLSTVGLSPS